MALILDGKTLSKTIVGEVAESVARLRSEKGIVPGLAVVLVGEDPASKVYVGKKAKACERAGILSRQVNLPVSVEQEELESVIDSLNGDPAIHGILVQLPLPGGIDTDKILRRVSPLKDVDGFHPENAGRLLQGDPLFVPCTPLGVIELLKRNGIAPAGKRVTIVGRSNIVGKPLAALLLRKGEGGDATVTVCHSRTRNLPEVAREADILVAAIGRPAFVTAEMVRDGAVVVDVGINRVADPTRKRGYRLVGDVDFEAVKEKASAITPVPGGIGPMTVAMLLKNTLRSAELSIV